MTELRGPVLSATPAQLRRLIRLLDNERFNYVTWLSLWLTDHTSRSTVAEALSFLEGEHD